MCYVCVHSDPRSPFPSYVLRAEKQFAAMSKKDDAVVCCVVSKPAVPKKKTEESELEIEMYNTLSDALQAIKSGQTLLIKPGTFASSHLRLICFVNNSNFCLLCVRSTCV